MPTTKCGFDDSSEVSGADLLVQFGPTLFVDIGFDPTYVPSQGKPAKPPTPGITQVRALVDTGATESCIDSGLAMQLSLPIIDRRALGGVSGIHHANVHLAQIRVPSLLFTIYGAFAAVNLAAGGQPHLALIGRTFLRSFTMSYEGRTGTVTITS